MKILTKASDIRQAVKDIKPNKVAVAFVGMGWEDYVSSWDLTEIVLWPTVGSNPKAIDEIMKEIGHENVYFLDGLHAKFYLGNKCALLGSCNLSNNGMRDNGLYEAAILIHEKEELKYLDAQFEHYKELANKAYPTLAKKTEKLEWLYKESSKAIRYGDLIPDEAPSLLNFVSGRERIHIVWYFDDDVKYNKEPFYAAVPEAYGKEPEDYYANGPMTFLEDDDVKPGDWILCWRANEDGMPHKTAKVEWYYVHHVISKMAKDEPYTKVAGQNGAIKKGSEPFKLDPVTQKIIKECLTFDRFKPLRSDGEKDWVLKPADKVTPDFIKTIQAMAQKKASKPKT